MGKLTAKQLDSLQPKEKLYRITDGDGLSIEVSPAGRKTWRFRYRINGRERTVSLGRYPDVTLSMARRKASEARLKLYDGIDPFSLTGPDAITFRKAVERYLEEREGSISPSHYKRTANAFRNYAYPVVGERPLEEIGKMEVLSFVNPLVASGRVESAKKLFFMTQSLFKWAALKGYCDTVPTAAVDTKTLFGSQEKRRYAAVTDPKEFCTLMGAISGYSGNVIVRYGLEMLALTALRPGNVRMMEWDWIDFDGRVLTIPKEKMKIRQNALHEYDDFRVPLSDRAIESLRKIHTVSGAYRYVFPSPYNLGKPLSDAAFNVALRRLGYDKEEMTAHGFRSSFSTIANESGRFSKDVIEAALAHFGNGSIARRYNRGDLLDLRRELMQWWGEFIGGCTG